MLQAITEDFQQLANWDVHHEFRCDFHLPSDFPWPSLDSSSLGSVPSKGSFSQWIRSFDAIFLIAPETAGILYQLAKAVHDAGGKLIGSSPDSIRKTADKKLLADYWLERGVPTPPTWIWGSEPANLFPVIYKERASCGSDGFHIVSSQQDYLTILQKESSAQIKPDRIVQPYLEGIHASVSLLIGPKETIPLLAGEQLFTKDHQYSGGNIPLNPPLSQRAIALALAAVTGITGLQGFVGLDMILGKTDYVLEINPRLTSSYLGLRQIAKFNLAEAILEVASGEQIPSLLWQEEDITFQVL